MANLEGITGLARLMLTGHRFSHARAFTGIDKFINGVENIYLCSKNEHLIRLGMIIIIKEKI